MCHIFFSKKSNVSIYLQRKVRLRRVSFSTSTGWPIAVSSSSSLKWLSLKKGQTVALFLRQSPAERKQALGGPKPVASSHQGVRCECIFQQILKIIITVLINKKCSPASRPRSQSAIDRHTSKNSLRRESCLSLLHNQPLGCSG